MISIKDLKHGITEERLRDENHPDVVPQKKNSAATSRGPSPNRGASVPDYMAVGPDSQNKREWQEQRGIDREKQIKIKKVSHMRYQHPDLQQITGFLRDFGMTVTKKTETQRWYRGYGPDQYVYYAQEGPAKYLGGAFEVESRGELEKVLNIVDVRVLSNGIEEMKDAPGGGLIVMIEDPEGFPINFICDQAANERKLVYPEEIIINHEHDKPRQRKFQRFGPGPAAVHKLGHFGLVVADFDKQMDWYTRNFNLVPSDILYVPKPPSSSPCSPSSALASDQQSSSFSTQTPTSNRQPVALFASVDLKQTLVDHHTFFMTSLPPTPPTATTPTNPPRPPTAPMKSKSSINTGTDANTDTRPPIFRTPHVHHSSYEVHSYDTQHLSHAYLAQKGYSSVWGVGRHILGSQIFDYWWDTTGFMVEHYADGDLVNEDTPVGFGPAGHEGLAVWGPEVPGAFLE